MSDCPCEQQFDPGEWILNSLYEMSQKNCIFWHITCEVPLQICGKSDLSYIKLNTEQM
jgi:hypothetical protein